MSSSPPPVGKFSGSETMTERSGRMVRAAESTLKRLTEVLSVQTTSPGAAPTRAPLLPAAALYGANASGKSNVLRALDFMRRAVRDSARPWPPDGGVPREPFAWDDTGASVFEVTFVVDDTRFEYGFVAEDACFSEEWLFAWPSGKKKHV